MSSDCQCVISASVSQYWILSMRLCPNYWYLIMYWQILCTVVLSFSQCSFLDLFSDTCYLQSFYCKFFTRMLIGLHVFCAFSARTSPTLTAAELHHLLNSQKVWCFDVRFKTRKTSQPLRQSQNACFWYYGVRCDCDLYLWPVTSRTFSAVPTHRNLSTKWSSFTSWEIS